MSRKDVDLALVRAVLAGDDRAAFALDAYWRPRIITFAMRQGQDQDSAEDIAQMALVRAFANLPRFKQDSRFGTWVFTIAKNLLINQSRSAFHRHRDAGADVSALTGDRRDEADDAVNQRETREHIDVALSKLSPKFRTALVMAFEEDRPYEEIATLTRANMGTVKSRVFRARRQFAAHYGTP